MYAPSDILSLNWLPFIENNTVKDINDKHLHLPNETVKHNRNLSSNNSGRKMHCGEKRTL